MLFNCLHCCKAISSQAPTCPYCMLETNSMVREVTPAAVPKAPKFAFFMKRSAYRARKAAEGIADKLPKKLPEAPKMPNIAQVVNGLRAVKH
jgi:hypothetical protein